MANPLSTAISTVTTVLKTAFGVQLPQSPQIPPSPLIALGAEFKQGLSATDIAGKIIDKKKKYGIPITPLPSGQDNLDLIMETIRVETIIEHFIENGLIVISIPPGAIQSVGYGTTINNSFVTAKGFIR